MTRDFLNWGVLGRSRINKKTLPALKSAKGCRLHCVSARNRVDAYEYRDEWNADKAVQSYEALIECEDVEVVYNSLPNHLHFEWTVKALQAGKHVLVEKPIVLSVDELGKLYEVAKENKVYFVEGFMFLHLPLWRRIKEAIYCLGKVNAINSSFHYPLNLDEVHGGRNLPTARGGGVVWDIGCYLTCAIAELSDDLPQVKLATVTKDHGVDVAMSAQILAGSHMTAELECSFESLPCDELMVRGSKGVLRVSEVFKGGSGGLFELLYFEGQKDSAASGAAELQPKLSSEQLYVAQFENFTQMIRQADVDSFERYYWLSHKGLTLIENIFRVSCSN